MWSSSRGRCLQRWQRGASNNTGIIEYKARHQTCYSTERKASIGALHLGLKCEAATSLLLPQLLPLSPQRLGQRLGGIQFKGSFPETGIPDIQLFLSSQDDLVMYWTMLKVSRNGHTAIGFQWSKWQAIKKLIYLEMFNLENGKLFVYLIRMTRVGVCWPEWSAGAYSAATRAIQEFMPGKLVIKPGKLVIKLG